MKPDIQERILRQFRLNSGYARTRDILALGIHNVYLKELEEKGLIIKLKQGLYSLKDPELQNTRAEALLSIPAGVLCLGTALSCYGLTTWDPPEIHVAIPQGRKVKLPDYPPIALFYFSGPFFQTGISELTEAGHSMRIYNLEKTICDLVRFRKRIGIDILKEALGEYLKREDKNLNRLTAYAHKLKISSVLGPYMEVLI